MLSCSVGWRELFPNAALVDLHAEQKSLLNRYKKRKSKNKRCTRKMALVQIMHILLRVPDTGVQLYTGMNKNVTEITPENTVGFFSL